MHCIIGGWQAEQTDLSFIYLCIYLCIYIYLFEHHHHRHALHQGVSNFWMDGCNPAWEPDLCSHFVCLYLYLTHAGVVIYSDFG